MSAIKLVLFERNYRMAVDEQINFEITGSVDLALAKKMWAQKVSDELQEEETLTAQWHGTSESKDCL
jgi:hypothetical protein